MTEFTRRGVLATFLAAPAMAALRIEAAPAVPECVIDEPPDGFMVSLLDGVGTEVTERLPLDLKDEHPSVTFRQRGDTPEIINGYRLFYPPDLAKRLSRGSIDESILPYCPTGARLGDGDITIEFPGGIFVYEGLL